MIRLALFYHTREGAHILVNGTTPVNIGSHSGVNGIKRA